MTRLLKTIALLSLGAVSGCVSMESAKPAMQAMKGQPVDVAFAKLGYPDGQMNIAGKNIYVWQNHDSGTYSVPTTSTSTSWVNGVAINTTTYGTRTSSYSYECKLKVIADKANIIENWEWEGDMGGCAPYASRLTKQVS